MFKRNLKFRFIAKVPFWKKLHLINVCCGTDLYASGYSGITSLIVYAKNNYHLNCSICFCDGITTFMFEPIS